MNKKLFFTQILWFLFLLIAKGDNHNDSITHNSIVRIRLFNKSIISDSLHHELVDDERIVLNYTESDDITIKWIESDTINIENYIFSYKLEGFDEEWIWCGHDIKTRYTNLPAGQYIFKLKWAYNDIWNNGDYHLKIEILPAWWQTWWFRLATTLLFLTVPIILISVMVVQSKKISRLKSGKVS